MTTQAVDNPTPLKIDRMLERLASVRGVIACFLIYGVFHGVVTRAAGPALALDDVKLNIVTQSLKAGYMPENPPLFEWLLIAVQQVTGPTLLSFLIVKYGLFTLSGLFTYLAAHEAFRNRRIALCVSFSLVLFFQFGWNYHQAFTHTTALIATASFFWWALFRLLRLGDFWSYGMLGVALGFGFLSKYAFLGTAGLGFAALATLSAGRGRLADWRLALSFVVGAAIAFPHLSWLVVENADVISSMDGRLRDDERGYFSKIGEGAPAALWAVVSFFLPAALIAPFLGAGRSMFSLTERDLDETAKLAQRATLAGVIFLLGAVFALGLDGMQERYAVGFLYPGIFWLTARIIAISPGHAGRWALASLVVAISIFGIRVIQTGVAGAPFCSKCRQWVPYDPLAETIAEAGWTEATLVGFEDHTAGNLRRLFPKARVLSMHMPYYSPPDVKHDREKLCVFIWSPDLSHQPSTAILDAFDPITSREITVTWRRPFRKNDERTTTWRLGVLNGNASIANYACRYDNTYKDNK